MYRKEVNERSPMRVFENSMHGGLGRGNLGVIAARAGVGKSPLLVQIALDDLMRDRKVLHISHEQTVRLIYENSGLQFDPDIVQAFRAREQDVKRLSEELSDTVVRPTEVRTPFVIPVGAET